MRYDAVVAGAGPAGSAAAAHLARAGRRVLIVDRAEFPREKACGGGLTPRGVAALRRLGVDTAAPIFHEVSGLEMIGYGRSAATRFPSTTRWPTTGLVARRIDLDDAILQTALKAGAEFRPRLRILGPVVEDGACRGLRAATADGERTEFLAPLTIAADGATSVVARGAGLAGRAGEGRGFWYAAMRGYFSPVQPRSLRDGGQVIEFYPLRTPAGRWLPAYGWVFPLPGGAANVGVDLPHRPGLDAAPALRDAYDAFVARLRAQRPGFADAAQEAPPVGALLPEGMHGVRPGMPGLLLVGDAAGLITPYSGEGIVYALESAELAAEAALGSARPSEVLDAYRRALWDAYGFHFRLALAFMKGVRRAPLARLAAELGIGNPRVLRAAVRVMAHLIDADGSSTVSNLYLAGRRSLRFSSSRTWGA